MSLVSLNVKVGQAVQIGDVACIGVAERKGSQVKLTISTNEEVTLIPTGIFPPKFRPTGLGAGMRRQPLLQAVG